MSEAQYPQYPNVPNYPNAAGSWEGAPAPVRPPSVDRAVQLMYAGAALSLLSTVIVLADSGSWRTIIRKAEPHWTTTQVTNELHTLVEFAVLAGLFGAALWVWMARANGRGRNWARITGTVLFGINTLTLFSAVSQGEPVLSVLPSVLTWAIGLTAVVFLWRKESDYYFRPRRYQ